MAVKNSKHNKKKKHNTSSANDFSKDMVSGTGIVVDSSHDIFIIKLINESGGFTGHIVKATPNGKIRQNKIRILPGDKVDLEISPYDLNRGRIIYRHIERGSYELP